MSRFHRASLAALDLEPILDDHARDRLTSLGQRIGAPLPLSFVEWFGMHGAVEILHRHTNCDDVIAIESLGDPDRVRFAVGDRFWPREPLLPFMVENQGVCVWAIHLDGGDDPPVLVARDPEFEWRQHTPTFSSFIACQIEDHQKVLGTHPTSAEPPLLLQAQDIPLRDQDLVHVRARFREGTITRGWPAETQYRFSSDDGHILIWDDGETQADWFIAAPSEDALFETASRVWSCGELAESLYTNDGRAEAVLAKLRAV